MESVEHEICNNCKKEIPQPNYIMHTMHCARRITLCKNCKEPIPNAEFAHHEATCKRQPPPKPQHPPTPLENSSYFQTRKMVEDKKVEARKERYMQKMGRLVDSGYTMNSTSSFNAQRDRESSGMFDRYKSNGVERHSSNSFESSFGREENFDSNAGSAARGTASNFGKKISNSHQKGQSSGYVYKTRTSNRFNPPVNKEFKENTFTPLPKPDPPQEKKQEKPVPAAPVPPLIKRAEPVQSKGMLACKYCDLELPKLELEEHENYCGSRTDKCLECGELVMFKDKQIHMDSTHAGARRRGGGQRAAAWDSATERNEGEDSRARSNRPFRGMPEFDYDPMPYLPSAYQAPGVGARKKEGESYKDISRRLDCKTEYIRNILHDSAAITVPLRRSGTAPRNYFYHHDKALTFAGPAPQPPAHRRRNPPTELVIPCEFCNVPIPHEDLIQHETGCRPDLTRYNPRRRSSPDDDYYADAPQEAAQGLDDEDLPCEVCGDMIPASQLYSHTIRCSAL